MLTNETLIEQRKSATMTTKTALYTTDLFQDKNVPVLLKNHPIFSTPAIPFPKKAFNGIGITNFSQETDISRSAGELKKEGSYLWNILRDICNESNKARDAVRLSNESNQFLAPLAVRMAMRAKSAERARVVASFTAIAESCDPLNPDTWMVNTTIVNNAGKLSINLAKDVMDIDGKLIHKKGSTIFRLFNALRTQAIEFGVAPDTIRDLSTLDSFKIFGVENIPNKKYQMIFSADGKDGAWDLATMAMRGLKSCQSWDSEHPKCLVGSIVSRFVGIIYLTSGSIAEPHKNKHGTGEVWSNLGTKMMKRCIVRYAIDKTTDTPCLILDKMYPEYQQEVMKSFSSALSDRASYLNPKTGEKIKVPVYYGPEIGQKIKHIYVPSEGITHSMRRYEMSYQDTPIRSKQDLDANILSQHHQETRKVVDSIHRKFAQHLSMQIHNCSSSDKSYMTWRNLLVNMTPFTIAENISSLMMAYLVAPNNIEYLDSQAYSREYLKALFLQRKSITVSVKNSLEDFFKQNCSAEHSTAAVIKYLSGQVRSFVLAEISKLARR